MTLSRRQLLLGLAAAPVVAKAAPEVLQAAEPRVAIGYFHSQLAFRITEEMADEEEPDRLGEDTSNRRRG